YGSPSTLYQTEYFFKASLNGTNLNEDESSTIPLSCTDASSLLPQADNNNTVINATNIVQLFFRTNIIYSPSYYSMQFHYYSLYLIDEDKKYNHNISIKIYNFTHDVFVPVI